MGPTTTTHMLLGAILGWAILSPYAKSQGFAPGPVNDWETGSKGWIVWVSLAIMLADAVMNIGWLALRPLLSHGQHWISVFFAKVSRRDWHSLLGFSTAYTPLENEDSTVLRTRSRDSSQNSTSPLTTIKTAVDELPAPDAPPEHLVSNRIVYPGFILSVLLCIAAVHIAFPSIIPLWATILAILFSLVLSLMGVRALGETDLNPVSVDLTQPHVPYLTYPHPKRPLLTPRRAYPNSPNSPSPSSFPPPATPRPSTCSRAPSPSPRRCRPAT